jgi:hypothetical protein
LAFCHRTTAESQRPVALLGQDIPVAFLPLRFIPSGARLLSLLVLLDLLRPSLASCHRRHPSLDLVGTCLVLWSSWISGLAQVRRSTQRCNCLGAGRTVLFIPLIRLFARFGQRPSSNARKHRTSTPLSLCYASKVKSSAVCCCSLRRAWCGPLETLLRHIPLRPQGRADTDGRVEWKFVRRLQSRDRVENHEQRPTADDLAL